MFIKHWFADDSVTAINFMRGCVVYSDSKGEQMVSDSDSYPKI